MKPVVAVLRGALHAAIAAVAVPIGEEVASELVSGRVDIGAWEHLGIVAIAALWRYVGDALDGYANDTGE